MTTAVLCTDRDERKERQRQGVQHKLHANYIQGDCVLMSQVTKMLTQTKCDITASLFLKVTMKVQIIYCGKGYINVHKELFFF